MNGQWEARAEETGDGKRKGWKEDGGGGGVLGQRTEGRMRRGGEGQRERGKGGQGKEGGIGGGGGGEVGEAGRLVVIHQDEPPQGRNCENLRFISTPRHRVHSFFSMRRSWFLSQ